MSPNVITADVFQTLLTIVATLLASSGFWAYMLKRAESKNLDRGLLLALAHDRICSLSIKFIDLGSITQDEYENVCYLYTAYQKLGGNGTARRLMNEVEKLRLNTTNRRNTGELREKSNA